jgi:hypothetical protein
MKIIALTIVVLIVLIAFGGWLPSKQIGIVTSDVHDCRNTDPCHSSEAVRYSGTCLRKLGFEPDDFTLVWPCCTGLMVDPQTYPRRAGGIELLRVDHVFSTAKANELESICGVIRMRECHRRRIRF